MASEVLVVPEESLREVVDVIRAGLAHVSVRRDTRAALQRWVADIEEYTREGDEGVAPRGRPRRGEEK